MKSLFPYAGGKIHLIKYIEEIYRKSNKTAFIDVFGGSGKVLMNIDSRNKIYNDIDNSLVNIFETLRNNPGILKDKFQYSLNSRKLFYEYKNITDDSAENAFRRVYTYLMSFAGKGNHYAQQIFSLDIIQSILQLIKIIIIEIVPVKFYLIIWRIQVKERIF